MACRRRSGQQWYSILILIVLLLTTTSVALLHSHKDWAPDCQLCHVRDLPSVHTHSAANCTVSLSVALQSVPDDDAYHLKPLSITRASRAPPEAILFTA